MYLITVVKHEWSEENFVIIHFRVLTIRPTDDRNVIGGNFMIFVPKGQEVNYAIGTQYKLVNDIIEKESESVSDNSDEGEARGTSSDSRSV